ncbi:Tetratricopeptide repeat [Synechococcus sp. MIT S9508]|nr:Tetratricopeptide repeat [Synechococcus sp. MIT S9508]
MDLDSTYIVPNYTNLRDLSDKDFQALLKDLPENDRDLAVEIGNLKSVKDVPDKHWDRFERYVLHKGQKNLKTSETPILLWPKWKKVGLIALTVFLGIAANNSRSWFLIVIFLYYAFLSSQLIIDTFKKKEVIGSSPQKSNNKEDTKEYYEIGLEYLRNDDYQKAISNFTKAIVITPGVSALYVAQGSCKIFLEDYQSAIDDFTKAIELSPEDAKPYYQRALARQGLDGCIGDEAANDIRQAADLGDKAAIDWVITNLKGSIKRWTNSLIRAKEGFNMDESSEQYKYWAYQDSDDENNEEWIHKFLDVAAECFISSRHETREELAKTQVAKVYSDFYIYVLDFPFIESMASLKRFVQTLDIDIYDRLLFRLVGSKLNDKWSEFYNTRLYNFWDKQGEGVATLETKA